jgi:hypothetical protein
VALLKLLANNYTNFAMLDAKALVFKLKIQSA